MKRELLIIAALLVAAMVCTAKAQYVYVPQPAVVYQPLVMQPQYVTPPMAYTPVYHSGPLGLLWWRSWEARPVATVPVQSTPPQQQPAPLYQAPQQSQQPTLPPPQQ